MIPDLAFHNHDARPVADMTLMRDWLTAMMPRTRDFSALGNEAAFVSKTADVQINGMTLIAVAHTPSRLERNGCPFPELWLPLHGHLLAFDGESQYLYGGDKAYFCNSGQRDVETTTVSVVSIRHAPVDRSSCGHGGRSPGRRHSCEIQNRRSARRWCEFSGLVPERLATGRCVASHPRSARKLAMDDVFYRLIAGLLRPDILQPVEAPKQASIGSKKRIAGLCEHLQANLTQSIAMTDMEQISGMSARSLQYAFQKSYGMRPKEWLRKQRLHAARAILLQPDQAVKLTALAYDFCFPSPSVFSRAYQMEFGELPSETLARRQGLST